jgi:hypothetical protein
VLLDPRLKFRQFLPARQGAAVDRALLRDLSVGEFIVGPQRCDAFPNSAFG